MRKKIQNKVEDFQEAKGSWKAKERELAVAREKMKQVRLLKKKGQTVESGMQKQKEEVARLIYEKAVCRYQMGVKWSMGLKILRRYGSERKIMCRLGFYIDQRLK